MGGMGKADSSVTWCHPDFSGRVTNCRNPERQGSRTPRVLGSWSFTSMPPLLARPARGNSGEDGHGCRRGIVTEKFGFLYFGYFP